MSRRYFALVLSLSVALASTAGAATRDSHTAQPSLRQLAKALVATGEPGAIAYVRDAGGAGAGTAG